MKIWMCDVFPLLVRRKFSVEYETETSVINYTSDLNDTSFEASTTGYAHVHSL